MSEILNGADCCIHKGDVIPHMLEEMPPGSVDMAVTSVPFPAMFAYTDDESDIGNSEPLGGGAGEMKLHFAFFFAGLRRVLAPGRVAIIHCMQIPRLKRAGEGEGLIDFRGLLIRLGCRAGLIYDFDWHVRTNPQAQAIRTRSRQLQFAGLEGDRAASRGALGYYLIKFRAPGENARPIEAKGQVTRNNWIDWAEGSWKDIIETDTLNVAEGRGENDTKHICPLQLGVIERCLRLYSDPGEIVFDPFTGIGSTGFVALGGASPVTKRRLEDPRRFYGAELKDEYHAAALRNLERAKSQHKDNQRGLFSNMEGPCSLK